MKLRYIAFAVAVAAGIASLSAKDNKKEIARNLNIFNSVYKAVNSSYVDTIDAQKAIRAAIDAMLSELDPFTEYIPEEDAEDFRTISTGEFGGIGAYISQNKARETFVSEPQEGTPAALSGLKAGDVFVTIDGDTVTTIGSDKVRERLRGQAGTGLSVSVRRRLATGDTIVNVDITRAKIEVPTVPYWGVVRDTVGYISLNTFNEKSYPEVKKAVEALVKDPRVKGIALDLRGNGGGLMESAINIVSIFTPKGTEVLRTRGRNVTNEKIYRTTKAPVDVSIPLVVIIDDNSASSSEIVAGSLQDIDRAVIIGERSYGKGLVQSTLPIPYNGLVKVTTQRYYIPSGRLIQAIDWSHRNADGTVARKPDSLTNVFYTKAGRQVRDGGGITPDVKVEYPDISRLTYTLVTDNKVFDFVTRYAAEHEQIAEPADFVSTDEFYDEFKASIDPSAINYDKPCEVIIDELEKAAKREGYLDEAVTAKIAELREVMHHDLAKDLDANRRQIEQYLVPELLRRYYYQRGATAYSLKSDPAVAQAARLLANRADYTTILTPANKPE